MSKSILLSERHGVNPTIPICFWCRKEKNEIAMLGLLKDDAAAPRHALLDYDPCPECEEKMASGITVLAITDRPNTPNQFPIQKNGPYPTGDWVVINPEALKPILSEDMYDQVIKIKKLCVDQTIFDQWTQEAIPNEER